MPLTTLTRQHHELSNLHLAGAHFSTLSTDDVSRQYFEGQRYISSFWSKFKTFFSIGHTANELAKFYPYADPVIVPKKLYEQSRQQAIKIGAATSVISVAGIYQLAKQGIVLPFLSKYGKFFKTHRLFRQYIYAIILPTTLLLAKTNWDFVDEFENLWGVHARRLNHKILRDPSCTIYPPELREDSEVGCWNIRQVHPLDRKLKWDNEKTLVEAYDWQQTQFEAQQFKEEKGEDGEGQGQGEASEEAEAASAQAQDQ